MMGPRANTINGDDEGSVANVGGSASRPLDWDLGPPTVPEGDRWFGAAINHGFRLTVGDVGRPLRAMFAVDNLWNRIRRR